MNSNDNYSEIVSQLEEIITSLPADALTAISVKQLESIVGYINILESEIKDLEVALKLKGKQEEIFLKANRLQKGKQTVSRNSEKVTDIASFRNSKGEDQ